jgi:pyruvate/2-oxoglutarate dehydrogenase complex dihydrolipoamide dehydrogenase (E3) component
VAHLAGRAEEFGVTIDGDISTDMAAVVDRQQRVVESIRSGAYDNVENADNLDLVEGHGVFESATTLSVGNRTLSAERIVLNTGARPVEPPIEGLDEVDTLDSTSALELREVPDHLAVIGGGSVGCEFAQMYARFGADVTVFQRPERLLPEEDPDVSGVIEDIFTDEGIDVRTGTTVGRLEASSNGATVTASTSDGEATSVDVSHVLLAAGRRANTDGIDLKTPGIDLDEHRFVTVDHRFQTTAESVYAIGDVTGPPMFTHSARDDANLLYRHLVKDEEINTDGRVVPHAVFTDPQVGHVGLTEQEAHDAGYEVGVGRDAFAAQGKPKALGETEGFVKLVTNAETDELLGAHVVGEQGAEIVHELVLAVRLGATATDIADTIHIHPTLPETINSAAGGVHKPS